MAYITTEISDKEMATRMGAIYAPSLSTVKDGIAKLYRVANGSPDRLNVLDSIPGQEAYSPLRKLSRVTWKDDRPCDGGAGSKVVWGLLRTVGVYP